jgi:hypothetical protein
MKWHMVWAVLVSVVLLVGCAQVPLRNSYRVSSSPEIATLPLANCTPPMDDPDYWIIKLKQPDRIFLTPRQINALNQGNLDRGLSNNVFSEKIWSTQPKSIEHQDEESNNGGNQPWTAPASVRPGYVTRAALLAYLKEETERIKSAPRWDSQGNKAGAGYFQKLDNNLNFSAIQEENRIQYGLTLRRTDFRYYPTLDALKTQPSPWEFDGIQVSAVQAYQPLAVLHASRDGKWFFAFSPACRGWVASADVLLSNSGADELKPFIDPPKKLVILGHLVSVVSAPGDTLPAERFYMGTACPLLAIDPLYYKIALPDVDGNSRLVERAAYISRQECVREGFLPCTARNIYIQAFRLLRTPYSWGGQGEYRDCSQLVMDVYATVGLALPRNSGYQGQVGRKQIRLARRHKPAYRQAQLNRVDRPALLQFPGHIMLYIGREGNHYYALHDIWSFRKPDTPGRDKKLIIGQVVVSDLSLGESSTKGSLLERITVINLLQP